MNEPSTKSVFAKANSQQGKLAKATRWLTILTLSIVAGVESAFIVKGIKLFINHLVTVLFKPYEAEHIILANSLLSGISILLFIGLVIFIPKIWRKVVGISKQRAIIYTTIQLFGISIGLIGLSKGFSFWLTFFIVFSGTRTWWSWEHRWRGVGHSPSIRAGIIRPKIHPGQIWFAYVPGEKETKNRPIMTLKQADNGRWVIAYFTTRAPKYQAQEKYFIAVKADTLRGMEKDSWINISDTKALKRGQFRTYIGLAPKALYEEVCRATNVEPDPLSWTIDENLAGESFGPMEAEFRRAIGMTHGITDPRRSVEGLRSIFKSFFKLNIKS